VRKVELRDEHTKECQYLSTVWRDQPRDYGYRADVADFRPDHRLSAILLPTVRNDLLRTDAAIGSLRERVRR